MMNGLVRLTIIISFLFLVACGGGGGGSSTEPDSTTVWGHVVNGPIVGATVSIYADDGRLIGQAITDDVGYFELGGLTSSVSYRRVVAREGTLNGVPYSGELSGICGRASCAITPLSTLIDAWASQYQMSYHAAHSLVFKKLELSTDPFMASYRGSATVEANLDEIKDNLLKHPQGISGWVDNMLNVLADDVPLDQSWNARNLTIPDTGQSSCYAGADAPHIECAETGQDGEYTRNPMSFADNADGTVTDTITGLRWQRSDDGSARTWQRAKDYCEKLVLGGSDMWRLPSRRELLRIVDYGREYPSVNPVFAWKTSIYYWSDSPHENHLSDAWNVNFMHGNSTNFFKTTSLYTRCVLGDYDTESSSSDRYSNNNDGTVTDNITGLIWQKTDDGDTYTWENALTYCSNLSLGNSNRWRLPNIKELESIIDLSAYNPAIDANVFRAKSMGYWSSTSVVFNADFAWNVSFGSGSVSGDVISNFKGNSQYVRCVR